MTCALHDAHVKAYVAAKAAAPRAFHQYRGPSLDYSVPQRWRDQAAEHLAVRR